MSYQQQTPAPHKTIHYDLLFSVHSENYIFGKFDTFCRRLEKIADMLNTMEAYSGLADVRSEGIDIIVVKYKTIVENTKKKNYDILDHRKPEVSCRHFFSSCDIVSLKST